MLFNKVRFCLVKGELIREVECAVCKVPPAERYDRRMEERRSGANSEERDLRTGKDHRRKRHPLCPGLLRISFLKIFYSLFKTPYAGIFIIIAVVAALLIGAALRLNLIRKPEKKPAVEAIAEEDARKRFLDFATQEQSGFTKYSGKNKYSIQLVLIASKIIDGFLEKFSKLPESVPGGVVDDMFMDSYAFYFNGANVLFENYFYVEDAQVPQLMRRLELLLIEAENLFDDWEKVNSRLPDYANSHIHAVYTRKISNSLALFKSNITKLKSGNIIKEPLVIPALDIKKL